MSSKTVSTRPAEGSSEETWSSYMLNLYATRTKPVLGTYYIDKLEELAREKLKADIHAFLYVFGSAGACQTAAGNLAELATYRLIPRMLRDATVRNLDVTLFGKKYRSPLFVAPVGVQGLMHPDAELASARAASKVGVPFILSTAASRTIEAVAEANGSGDRWYQLYWPVDKDVCKSLLQRAKASGYSTLVITLDTMLLGWRPHDLDRPYLPFLHGFGSQVGFSDPVFMAKHGLKPILEPPVYPYDPDRVDRLYRQGDAETMKLVDLSVEWLKQTNSGTFRTWDEIQYVRDNWDGPIVLKGIMSVKDAEIALDYGIEGIVVSNHGGRQVDGAIPAVWALQKICSSEKIKAAQQSGKLTVMFDSGIRNGSDIIKAMAIGAQAVLIARPFMYGLAVAGQAGVEQVLRSTLADLEVSLGLLGYKNLQEIQGKGEEVVVKIGDPKL